MSTAAKLLREVQPICSRIVAAKRIFRWANRRSGLCRLSPSTVWIRLRTLRVATNSPRAAWWRANRAPVMALEASSRVRLAVTWLVSNDASSRCTVIQMRTVHRVSNRSWTQALAKIRWTRQLRSASQTWSVVAQRYPSKCLSSTAQLGLAQRLPPESRLLRPPNRSKWPWVQTHRGRGDVLATAAIWMESRVRVWSKLEWIRATRIPMQYTKFWPKKYSHWW